MTNFKISVPKPCHEDWNAMSQKEIGRFCGSCEKVVVDFTTMSETELKDYFITHTHEKTCGHFKQSQLAITIPKHQEVLTKLYITTETNISSRFFRVPILFAISIVMTIAGCKLEARNKPNGAAPQAKQTDSTSIMTMGKVVRPQTDTIIELELLGEVAAAPIVDSTKATIKGKAEIQPSLIKEQKCQDLKTDTTRTITEHIIMGMIYKEPVPEAEIELIDSLKIQTDSTLTTPKRKKKQVN
jgi:hypothetical protein